VEITKKRSISFPKNKSLLKPDIASQDKVLVNPGITTRKEGSLLKPVILPGRENSPQ